MSKTLKFIHASDLHLDQPFCGIADIPKHIRTALIDSAYIAAEKIFDYAINEKVDFVLLSGDVADIDRCGPRGISFLSDQFARLAEENIHVYWAGGEADQLDRWPAMISHSPTVHLFTSTLVEEIQHRRGGRVVASILGAGYDRRKRRIAEFRAEDSNAFAIGLCYGNLETEEIAKTGVEYWALGGNHIRRTFTHNDSMLVFPGTSQSRGPHEAGEHGSTLVEVDETGFISTQNIATDAIRWIEKRIRISEGMSKEEIRTRFEDQAFSLIASADGQLLLVDWEVVAEGTMNGELHCNGWLEETADWLRKEFGQSEQPLWTLQIHLQTPRSLPEEWYEEDSMLGDFLREVRHQQQDTSGKLDISKYIDAESADEWLHSAVQLDSNRRREILRDAALAGVKILTGSKGV